MAATTRPLVRCSILRVSSSMANITPASGALNAAAIPAAPPATSSACGCTTLLAGSQRRACSITPAAICTEGPSRPIGRPPSSPPAHRPILVMASLSDTSPWRSFSLTELWSAVITCGMPEPVAPGTKREVTQAISAHSVGVSRNGIQGCAPRQSLNRCSARSQIQVKPTTLPPASAAYTSTMARETHSRELTRSSRMAASTSGCACGWCESWEECMAGAGS